MVAKINFRLFASLVVLLLATCSWGQSSVAQEHEMREWNDHTGNYSVNAKLLRRNRNTVELLKEDKLVVTVLIENLSENDRKYLFNNQKDFPNPFIGGVPLDSESGNNPKRSGHAEPDLSASFSEMVRDRFPEARPLESSSKKIFVRSEAPIKPIEADPYKQPMAEFKPMIRQYELSNHSVRHSKPILLDQENGIFAVSSHETKESGWVDVYDPESVIPKRVIESDFSLHILDHNCESNQTIAVIGADKYGRGGDLLIIQNLNSGNPVPVSRWRVPQRSTTSNDAHIKFASLVSGNSGIVLVDSTLYFWDLGNGECATILPNVSSEKSIAVSPGRRYLALAKNGHCKIIDIQMKALLGSVPFSNIGTPAISFSFDGEKIALVAGTTLVAWDLTKSKKTNEIVWHGPIGRPTGWVGKNQILTELGGLFDLELDTFVWRYHVSSGKDVIAFNGGIVGLQDTYQTFFAIKIPHDDFPTDMSSLSDTQNSQLAMSPGSSVKIIADSVDKPSQKAVLKEIEKAITRAGWTVSKNANTMIEARHGRGKKRTMRFSSTRDVFSRGEKVELTPYVASVVIVQDGKVIWSNEATNHVPNIIMLERGQTIQEAVKEHEKPNMWFFENLAIPPKILKPEAQKSIGRSRLYNGKWIEIKDVD